MNQSRRKKIYEIAKKSKTEVILAKSYQVVHDKKGLIITNLLGSSTDSDNENSIITLLKYKDFTALFTGDAGACGLSEMINDLPRNISVLKVPHHGAIGGLNKELVEHLNPKYSIISVGENYFGHPSNFIIELLKNSKILRTDIDNAILIKFNNKLEIFNFDINKKDFILNL